MVEILTDVGNNLKASTISLEKKLESVKKIFHQAQLEGIKTQISDLDRNFTQIEKNLSGLN
jgi:replicative DNA helicase